MSRSKKITIEEEEDGYKYPLSPNGYLSLRHRTSQDSKGKSEV